MRCGCLLSTDLRHLPGNGRRAPDAGTPVCIYLGWRGFVVVTLGVLRAGADWWGPCRQPPPRKSAKSQRGTRWKAPSALAVLRHGPRGLGAMCRGSSDPPLVSEQHGDCFLYISRMLLKSAFSIQSLARLGLAGAHPLMLVREGGGEPTNTKLAPKHACRPARLRTTATCPVHIAARTTQPQTSTTLTTRQPHHITQTTTSRRQTRMN